MATGVRKNSESRPPGPESQKSQSRRKQTPVVMKKEVEDIKPIKEEEKPLVLTPDSIACRLAHFPKTEINVEQRPELLIPVSRKFIYKRYGGQAVPCFPCPGPKKLALHGIRQFAFLKPDYNPHIPDRPGVCGLSFTGLPTARTLPLFVWKDLKKEGKKWLYCGHYRFEPSESLTREEWLGLDDVVRNTWVKGWFTEGWTTDQVVMDREVVQAARARHRLKKRFHQNGEPGRKPTADEIQDAIARGEHLTVDAQEIHADFDSGFLRISVEAMVCVEYKEDFQRELLKGYRSPPSTWPTFPPSLKRKYARAMRAERELKADAEAEAEEKKLLDEGKKIEALDEEELPRPGPGKVVPLDEEDVQVPNLKREAEEAGERKPLKRRRTDSADPEIVLKFDCVWIDRPANSSARRRVK